MSTFLEDTQVRGEQGRLTATLSRRFEIWGPNGGYLSAILLRAAGRVVPADQRPVSFSAQYLARAEFAEVQLDAVPVKQGRNACCVNVSMSQGGRVVVQAQAWTSSKTDGPTTAGLRMPEVPPPDALQPWTAYLKPGQRPFPFNDNFDIRPVGNPRPGTPDPRGAVLEQWVRYVDFGNDPDPFAEQARALLWIDTAPWPTHARNLAQPADYTGPSLDVSAWFHRPSAGVDWLLVDSRAGQAHGGLIHGDVRIWSPDGQLIASGATHMLHAPMR